MKYKMKQIEVEARQVTKENFRELAAWCGGLAIGPPERVKPIVRFQSPHGLYCAMLGSWIFRMPDGFFAMQTDEEFKQDFDPVPESTPIHEHTLEELRAYTDSLLGPGQGMKYFPGVIL